MTNKRVHLFKTSPGLELNFLRFSCDFTYSVRSRLGLLLHGWWPLSVESVGVWVVVRNIVLWLCGRLWRNFR